MAETQKLSRPVVDVARAKDAFRKVLWTGEKTQPVPMVIPEGGEVHEGARPAAPPRGRLGPGEDRRDLDRRWRRRQSALGHVAQLPQHGVDDANALHHLWNARVAAGHKTRDRDASGRGDVSL